MRIAALVVALCSTMAAAAPIVGANGGGNGARKPLFNSKSTGVKVVIVNGIMTGDAPVPQQGPAQPSLLGIRLPFNLFGARPATPPSPPPSPAHGVVHTLSDAGVYAPHPRRGVVFRFVVSYRVIKQWGPLPQRWFSWRPSFQHRAGTAKDTTNPFCVQFCHAHAPMGRPVCETTPRWRLFGAMQDPLVASVLIYNSELPKAQRPTCTSKPTRYIMPDGSLQEVTAAEAGAGSPASAGQRKQ